MNIFIGVLAMTLLLWCMTGYYLATKYQNLLSRIKDFREKVQSHSLEHGTTDNVLYELVISESRKLLPDETKKNLRAEIRNY